ncbi:MAG: hypothetical protein WBC06_11940 [Chitinophagaceae bacterium]
MKKIFLFVTMAFLISSGHAQLNTEQKKIKQVFFDFLKFYQKNESKFNSFQLYKGTGPENNPPYKILWKGVEKYFTYLRTSVPYVGEAYIKAERNHFKFSDSCFKDDPVEEMPVGFDYDRWAGGQESIDHTIKWYTDPKNKYEVIIKGTKATLRIGAELYEGALEKDRSWYFVPFVKEKGKWKMADNIYHEDEEDEEEIIL